MSVHIYNHEGQTSKKHQNIAIHQVQWSNAPTPQDPTNAEHTEPPTTSTNPHADTICVVPTACHVPAMWCLPCACGCGARNGVHRCHLHLPLCPCNSNRHRHTRRPPRAPASIGHKNTHGAQPASPDARAVSGLVAGCRVSAQPRPRLRCPRQHMRRRAGASARV